MRILLLGGGAREHALCWKLRQSALVEEIFCSPGNGGISQLARIIELSPLDFPAIRGFAGKEKISLVVVGPEEPLVRGITNFLAPHGISVFGPLREGAMLEGSKEKAKRFMEKYGIPSGKFTVARSIEEGVDIIRSNTWARVIKADGLAQGKGVIVTHSENEALSAFREISERFSLPVIIEERLEGREVSILSFVDGKTILPMVSAADYKRAYDRDRGPNTGGMGSISPAPHLSDVELEKIWESVLIPTLQGLISEGIHYCGVLYAGLIVSHDGGTKVLEYNCRFGDPETQAILPRLKTDLVRIMESCVNGSLDSMQDEILWDERSATCVVMASAGYPGEYEKGKPITGIESLRDEKEIFIFHGGTKLEEGKLLTSGGRVLSVTALGDSLPEATERAYEAIGKISFDGQFHRKDIGNPVAIQASGT